MSDRKRKVTAWVSLGYPVGTSVLFVFVALGVLGLLFKVLHMPMDGQRDGFIASAIAIGGAGLALFGPAALRRRLRVARLAKMEFPFDVDAYLDALNQDARHGALALEVELGDGNVPDATTLALLPTSVVRPSPGKLVLISPAMRTMRESYPKGLYYYNGDLDRWFAQACDRVLRPLHSRQKITALRVRYVPDLDREVDAGARETPREKEEPKLPKMTVAQRQVSIRWLVLGLVPGIALPVAAGLTDANSYFSGVLAGAVFTTTLGLGAVAFVLLQLRYGSTDGVLLRRPSEWIAKGILYSLFAFAILLLAELRIWTLGNGGPAAQWYSPAFFAARTVVYFVLWVGIASVIERASLAQDATSSSTRLGKLGQRAPRILAILGGTLWLVTLDWIVGLHRDALARALAPLVAANLAAGGVAAAVGLSSLIVRRFGRMGLLGGRVTSVQRAYASKWLLGASAAWLVTAIGVVFALLASRPAIVAAWFPHFTQGAWLGWTIAMVGVHLLALGIVAIAPRVGSAAAIAALLVILGHALESVQLVCPARLGTSLPTWIELGGFVTAIVGLWLVLFYSAGEQPVLPNRDPASLG